MSDSTQKETLSSPLTLKIEESKEIPRFTISGLRSIHKAGEYYVVTRQNTETADLKIEIFSQNGEWIRGIPKLLVINDYITEKFQNARLFRYQLPSNGQRDQASVYLQDLPPLLQQYLVSKNSSYNFDGASNIYNIYPVSIQLYEGDEFVPILEGKYLASKSPTSPFVVQLKDGDGEYLPHQQIKTFTISTDLKVIPDELLPLFNGAREELLSDDKTVGDYCLLLTDEGLKVVDRKNPERVVYKENKFADVKGKMTVSSETPSILYYLESAYPKEIKSIVMDGDPAHWQTRTARFPIPKQYSKILDLRLDPTNSILIIRADEGLFFHSVDTLAKVGELPFGELISIEQNGKVALRTIANYPEIVHYNIDFKGYADQAAAQMQQRLVNSLDIGDIFKTDAQRVAQAPVEVSVDVKPIVDKILPEFKAKADAIKAAGIVESVASLDMALERLRTKLAVEMVGNASLIPSILDAINLQVILPLKAEMYTPHVYIILQGMQRSLQAGLSLATITSLGKDVRSLDFFINFIDPNLRKQIIDFEKELQIQTMEYMRKNSEQFVQEASELFAAAEHQLKRFSSKAEMDDWLEHKLPQLLSRLGNLYHQCPMEAPKTLDAILKLTGDLNVLAGQYETKFKQEYALIREQASNKAGETAKVIETSISRLLQRIKEKNFKSRNEAETYVFASEGYKLIVEDIKMLMAVDATRASELQQKLEVALANENYAIDRNAGKQVLNSGEQVVFFGNTQYPKFEGKVKHLGARKTDVVFIQDQSSHGPGQSADKILGDVAVKIVDSRGHESLVRLFQDEATEDEYRFGFKDRRGEQIPASYMSGEQYRKLKRDIADWEKGKDRSLIQKEMDEKRNAARMLYLTRPNRAQFKNDTEGLSQWRLARDAWNALHKTEYQTGLSEYAKFCSEHSVSLLQQIDAIRQTPEQEYVNGKGYIPEWQTHWVVDAQTDAYLEEIAKNLLMQERLQEGMLLLKGHAGTGKDVLVKMFCERAQRPYFAFDCTKWTTESELSEDIVLESVDGASQTLKVPSVILNAITTPGALLYLNEFNAMPEQAQIFLHALLDEKRTLTLKTSPDRPIKVDPSVLIVGSMNQGYPGTYTPQIATRSRTVSLQIDYPPLYRKAEASDPNKTDAFSASEALRIARGVSSLRKLTIEPDLARNQFVKAWDREVNGIKNGSIELTPEQKIDMSVIMALVQFGDELRDHFIATFERQSKTAKGKKTIEVSQPLTLREMRRAADYLSNEMTYDQKKGRTPDDIARDLLGRFFLSHLDDEEAKRALLAHMTKNLNSHKRLAT